MSNDHNTVPATTPEETGLSNALGTPDYAAELKQAHERIAELESSSRTAAARAARMEIAVKHGLTFDRAAEIFDTDDPTAIAEMEKAFAAGAATARNEAEAEPRHDRKPIVFADDPNKPEPPARDYKAMAARLKKMV